MNIDYIAGFVDGEGSICIMNRKVRITIPQTNKEILEQIREYFGVGGITTIKTRKEHWKQAWVYYSGSNKASYKVLSMLDGYLILKQEKLKIAKELLEEYLLEDKEYHERKLDAIDLISKGLSYREIEKITGVSRSTICNYVKKLKKEGN